MRCAMEIRYGDKVVYSDPVIRDISKRKTDIGTPERHKKSYGVFLTDVDGELLSVVGATDYLDAFRHKGYFNEDQYNSVYQLIRDYQIGVLYKWKIVKELCDAHGLSHEDAEVEREEARRNYNAAVKYNPEFTKLSNLAHLLLEQVGVYIPPIWKMQKIADRLTYYYCNNKRIVVNLNPST